MCLLVNQQSTSPILSNEWLADFYTYNADGVGVMFANNGELIVKKLLPADENEFINFYHQFIAGKNCAFHLRMRTHGDIDLDNCHPYEVLNRLEHGIDLWLMHNGILSTGNKADESKSDTWHYIEDYLKPMLSANPDFAFHPSFSEIVGDHIGSSNKFILMDNEGRQAVINHGSGVHWAGLWLSNTYAWSASSSASKHPIKSVKKQKKQAKEKPEARSFYKYSNYGYPMMTDDYQDYYDQQELDYENLEMTLEDLQYMGFQRASSIPINTCLDFIEQFSFKDFQSIADDLINNGLTEEWFIQCVSDPIKAREAYPYLARKNHGIRVLGYE